MIIPIKAGIRENHNKLFRLLAKIRGLFKNSNVNDYRTIPVIINNFNRFECLTLLINWLEDAGMKKIYIIDNNSTYPPLLKYYNETPHTVFRLNKNVGYMSLWQTHVFMWFKNIPYVYTDPDVVPIEQCPNDAVLHFWKLLCKYPEVGKVGFALKIDDIPDHYPLKEEVQSWEAKFWKKEIENDVYEAMIDTTFALYRANKWGDAGMLKGLRTAGSYIARHLPWYIDPMELPDEERYYQEHANSQSSWYQRLVGKTKSYNG